MCHAPPRQLDWHDSTQERFGRQPCKPPLSVCRHAACHFFSSSFHRAPTTRRVQMTCQHATHDTRTQAGGAPVDRLHCRTIGGGHSQPRIVVLGVFGDTGAAASIAGQGRQQVHFVVGKMACRSSDTQQLGCPVVRLQSSRRSVGRFSARTLQPRQGLGFGDRLLRFIIQSRAGFV